MTVTDQIKILDKKIKQNEAQYDLDREAAKISVLSSNNLDKYEYLTGEDLSLKPSTVEQTKFECSPLGKIFNKGLSEEDKKEGLFKRIKNIEGKNEEQLKSIEDQGKRQLEEIKNINVGSKPLKTISFFSTISREAKELMNKIKVIDDWLETAQLTSTKTDGKTNYEFSKFAFPLKFASKIYKYDFTLQKAQDKQQELKIIISKLNNNYNPTSKIKIKEKNDTLKTAKWLNAIKNEIINAFKKGIFPYIDGFQVEKEKDEDTDEDTDEEIDTIIMPELESEESAAERINQQGEGVKILTPNQMLSRFSISLAQLEAGNNSEKLKNEVRQLLYSLYRSKNMTKQVYNSLIKSIWIKNIIIVHKIFIMIIIIIIIIIIIVFIIIIIIIIIITIIIIKGIHYKKWR